METFNKAVLLIESFTRKIVIMIMILMLGTILLDVIARNTSIRVRGLDEIARYSLVWIIFLVTAIGARYGDLVGMDSFAQSLPKAARKATWVIRRILFLVFLVFFGWYALGLVQLMISTGRVSPNLQIPLWFVYAPIFVGTALMFLSLVADLCIRSRRGSIDDQNEAHPEGAPWN